MAKRTKEQEQGTLTNHPYEAFEGSPLWRTLNRAIVDLVENDDLVEKTPREYIVGYIAKAISEAGLTKGA